MDASFENALYPRQLKSTRPTYLENRLTFKNQTWYIIKNVSLEHFDTIFKNYIPFACPYLKSSCKNRKIVTGLKWMRIL